MVANVTCKVQKGGQRATLAASVEAAISNWTGSVCIKQYASCSLDLPLNSPPWCLNRQGRIATMIDTRRCHPPSTSKPLPKGQGRQPFSPTADPQQCLQPLHCPAVQDKQGRSCAGPGGGCTESQMFVERHRRLKSDSVTQGCTGCGGLLSEILLYSQRWVPPEDVSGFRVECQFFYYWLVGGGFQNWEVTRDSFHCPVENARVVPNASAYGIHLCLNDRRNRL